MSFYGRITDLLEKDKDSGPNLFKIKQSTWYCVSQQSIIQSGKDRDWGWLKWRWHRVTLKGELWKWREVVSGVSPELALGPIPCNIFINEIMNVHRNQVVCLWNMQVTQIWKVLSILRRTGLSDRKNSENLSIGNSWASMKFNSTTFLILYRCLCQKLMLWAGGWWIEGNRGWRRI